MKATEALAVIEQALAGRLNALPNELAMLRPQAPLTVELLDLLGAERLIALSDRLVAAPCAAEHAIYTLLQLAAHRAAVAQDKTQVEALLERQLAHRPHDVGPRTALAPILAEREDLRRLIELLEPILNVLLNQLQLFSRQLSLLYDSALKLNRRDILFRLVGQMQGVDLRGEAMAIFRRLQLLAGFDDALFASGSEDDDVANGLYKALYTLNEYAVLEQLDALPETPSTRVDLAIAVAAACRSEGWSRPYRSALRMAARLLVSGAPLHLAEATWSNCGMPAEAYAPFLIMAGRAVDGSPDQVDRAAVFEATLREFEGRPDITTAAAVWSAAYKAGRFEISYRGVPHETAKDSRSEHSRSVISVAADARPGVDIWVAMTWREGADRLLRLVSAYLSQRSTVVILIGGDGRPPDLARINALLLVDDVHLFSRPFVTWGGQKLLYQNILEVMGAFRSSAPAGSWLQVVCDRSYPLVSLRRLGEEAADGAEHLNRYFYDLGPPAWRQEWENEVVDDLPVHYQAALDEAFETGYPARFVHLSTKSPIYGINDHRLNGTTFNYAAQAERITFDPRTKAHSYCVSPFAIDVRWMSFSRLQELVDVSTESGATYARPLHPTTMRWAHSVLSKYEMRNGHPFMFVDKIFAEALEDSTEFDELFTAMNLGFAPEMNIFDTIAASKELRSHCHHQHLILPSETAGDQFLPLAAEYADTAGRFFVRKTDLSTGRNLVDFFARRIFEEQATRQSDFFWAVPNGPCLKKGKTAPHLDIQLLSSLAGCRVEVRDLLKRRREHGRFGGDGLIHSANGALLAMWRWSDGALDVRFTNPALGSKRYESMGSDGRVLTLAPAELVSPHNDWSAFLDFCLDDMVSNPALTGLEREGVAAALSEPGTWTGAGDPDVALVCAFSDPIRSDFPVPAITAHGGVHEIRDVNGSSVALCSIDGAPALLRVRGAAATDDGRTVVLLARATQAQAAGWDGASTTIPSLRLPKAEIAGVWRISTLAGRREVRLQEDGAIVDFAGDPLGRWLLHDDGVRLFGLTGLRVAHAAQMRLDEGVWRLSGWAWKNMKDLVTFRMELIGEHASAA